MARLEPYVSSPLIRRLGGCGPGEGLTQTSVGVLRVREYRGAEGQTEFVPVEFQRRDGSAELVLRESGPVLRLRGSRGWMTMSPDGIELPGARAARGGTVGSRRTSYTERSVRRLAEQFLTDEDLRASVIGLERDLWIAMLEHSAVTETVPSSGLQPGLTTTATTIGTSTQPPAGESDPCSIERKVTRIETKIKEYVGYIKTAAQQAAECSKGCERYAWWSPERYLCQGQCLVGLFQDLFVATGEVINTIVSESVEYIVHCPPGEPSVPTYTGRVPSKTAMYTSYAIPNEPEEPREDPEVTRLLKEALADIDDMIACLFQGDVRAWRHDWDPRDPERGLVGVQLCVDGECAKKLRAAITGGTLAAAYQILQALLAGPGGVAAVFAAMAKITTTKAAISALTTLFPWMGASGAAGVVLGFLTVILYQAAAITAQLWLMGEKEMANGICLRHPSLLLGAGFFLAPAVSLSWPVTVSKR